MTDREDGVMTDYRWVKSGDLPSSEGIYESVSAQDMRDISAAVHLTRPALEPYERSVLDDMLERIRADAKAGRRFTVFDASRSCYDGTVDALASLGFVCTIDRDSTDYYNNRSLTVSW